MLKILDFDGTLINLWPRYHAVFCCLTNADISLEDYIAIKKKLKKDKDVARYFDIDLSDDYFINKRRALEDRDYLKLDRLIFSTDELNILLDGDVVILTRRSNEENFAWEMNQLEIQSEYYVLKDRSKLDWAKEFLMERHGENAVVVGDMTDDIMLSQLCGVRAIAVGWGLHEREDFDAATGDYEYVDTPWKLMDRLEVYKCNDVS